MGNPQESLQFLLTVCQDLANRQTDASARSSFMTVAQLHLATIKQALDQPAAQVPAEAPLAPDAAAV